ncbi:VOC family protein [Halobacterium hubeiense]|uniref:VOC family protein n=1 Tax=Halobacterium hubeiense TaxID=1407499 RepID=UPI003C78F22B
MNDTPFHLGHVHLKVRDLDRAVAFYGDVFDLELAETEGRFAFLSWGAHHHDVALQAVGADAPDSGRGVGLYHAAIEVDAEDALGDIYDELCERGVPATPVDHGISKALYFSDPAGNGLEAYVDTREDRNLAEWEGENQRFDPATL